MKHVLDTYETFSYYTWNIGFYIETLVMQHMKHDLWNMWNIISVPCATQDGYT
jgi:hypothetical protein